jgi:hypothetical protein
MTELLEKMGARLVRRGGINQWPRLRRRDGGQAWADFDVEEESNGEDEG